LRFVSQPLQNQDVVVSVAEDYQMEGEVRSDEVIAIHEALEFEIKSQDRIEYFYKWII